MFFIKRGYIGILSKENKFYAKDMKITEKKGRVKNGNHHTRHSRYRQKGYI